MFRPDIPSGRYRHPETLQMQIRVCWRIKLVLQSLLACGLALQSPVAAPRQMKQVIEVNHGSLRYIAETAFTYLKSRKNGRPDARLFSTGYLLEGHNDGRPIGFAWNGGPGATSSLLQFKGFGPKLLDGSSLSDNPDTLLPEMDLVFIDPVGTGYSRLLDPSSAKYYYSTVGDALATAQFIRSWLYTHNAANRKIFLLGESFGGYRAGGVALRLERSGQDVAGVILISGGVASGPLIPSVVRAALVTPQRTAAALALGRIVGRSDDEGNIDVLTATVRAATQWSLDTYLPALTYLHELSAQKRAEVAKQLSEFTGYPASRIDQRTLVITTREYLDAMSPTPGKSLSQYDMRTTAPPRIDDRAIDRYYRNIGVRNGPVYWDMDASNQLHPTGKGWIYNYIWPESAKWGSGYAEPWLPAAMKINPDLKVYVAAGLYDALNSCAENDVLVSMLEPELAKNYTVRCYLAGHIMYTDPRVRHELSRDIPSFVRAVLSTGG